MLLAYAVAFPSYAVFWSEGEVANALFLFGAGFVAITVAFLARYRALVRIHDGPTTALSVWGRWRASLVVRRVLGPPESNLELLAASGPGARFHSAFEEWWNLALPAANLPRLYWYLGERAAARVVGTSENPAVAVSHGLIGLFALNPELVRVVILHELAHVRHGDATVFASIRSFLVAWPVATAIVGVLSLSYLLHRADRPLLTALVLMVSALWSATLIAAWIFLLRYAGFLFSLRELHADVAAARWVGTGESFAATLAASYRGRRVIHSRLKSLFSLRLTHLSGEERLSFIRRPERLLMPKLRYFALSAVTVVLVQSSPFLAGFGNIGMIIFLSVFGWAVSIGIIANCFSTLWFSSQVGAALGARRLTILIVTMALAYHLPFMRLVGLSNLLLAPFIGTDFSEMFGENWPPIMGALRDGVWLISLTTAAAVVIIVSRMFQRRRRSIAAGSHQVSTYPLTISIAAGSVLYLFSVVLLRWESETPFPLIDRLSDDAYTARHVLPILTFGLMLVVAPTISFVLRRATRDTKKAKCLPDKF